MTAYGRTYSNGVLRALGMTAKLEGNSDFELFGVISETHLPTEFIA